MEKGKISDLLNETQAAKILGLKPSTLRIWRHRGQGPQFISVSARAIRYRANDIQDWIDNRIVSNCSQAKERRAELEDIS